MQSPGRGGPEHKAFQRRIQAAAESIGFRADIEKEILGGKNKIDVWLARKDRVIACEFSFTNDEGNESEKIARCLQGTDAQVAMICDDAKKLRKIADAVSDSVSPELATRVEYFSPESFFAYLRALPPVPKKKDEIISHGYKIKSSIASGSTEAQKTKEDAAIRAIAESMRKKKKKP